MSRTPDDGGEALTLENLVTALRAVGTATQAPPGDMYRLQPPIFGGDCDVEQFIREFEDVSTIAQWPAPVRLLQLRSCLTGSAKSYAIGEDVGQIYQALRARFGLTARDARTKLQNMRRDRRTSLQDHANAIERLALIVFSRTALEERRELIYEAFFSTFNDSGLQKHYLAAKITTIEEALEMGRSYYQVDNHHRADFTASQVKEAAKDDTTVAAVADPAPTSPQITMLLDMVKGLQLEVVRLQQQQTGSQRADIRTRPNRLNQLTCWGCGAIGNVQRQCPHKGKPHLNHQGSR